MKLQLVFAKHLLLAIYVLIVLSSCEQTDVERPNFAIAAPIDTIATNTLTISINTSDNQNVSQYRLQLLFADDFNAQHPVVVQPKTLTNIGNVNASSFNEVVSILINRDSLLTGNYRIIGQCTDDSGNLSDSDTATVFVLNGVDTMRPLISGLIINPNSNYTLADTITIGGLLVDDTYPVSYSISLVNNSQQTVSKGNSFINTDKNSVVDIQGELNWSAPSAGTYFIRIEAKDAYYNTKILLTPITLN